MKKYKKAYIEITDICNLSCSFCHKTKRKKAFMADIQFDNALMQVSKFTDYIYLHIMGEPLLHPQLDKILNTAEKYNAKVIITTNGTLIKNQQMTILNSKSVYKIVFSLHSFESNETNIDFEEYLDNILGFTNIAGRSTDIFSVLRLWNLDGKNRLNPYLLEKLKSFYCIDNMPLLTHGWKNDITLCKNIYLQSQKKFEWPDINKSISNNKAFCYALRDHFGVLCDGSVVPCCLDCEGDMILGNLFSQPLESILQSEKARRIYDGFSNRTPVEELCRRCEYSKRF